MNTTYNLTIGDRIEMFLEGTKQGVAHKNRYAVPFYNFAEGKI